MPEAVANGHGMTNDIDSEAPSTPLELLKAVKEVQERRISVWREYDDAFSTYLNPSSSIDNGPVNGSQNGSSASNADGQTATGIGCAGCSTSPIPLSEDLLAQILQITTQALIECSHRVRAIQTELAHSTVPDLAGLVDRIQGKENALLRKVVERDQLRKTTLKPQGRENGAHRVEAGAQERIKELDRDVQAIRAEVGELMQEVYAELAELQVADA